MGAYKIRATPTLNPVIARLVQARKDRDMSQTALALRLDTTQAAISRWENGTREISLTNVTRWAAALGFTLEPVVLTDAEGPFPELYAGGLS